MRLATLAFGATLGGYFGLLGLWLAWSTTPAHRSAAAMTLAIFVLPLLLPLRGLLDNRRAAYIWLGLLSLFYFIHGAGAVVWLKEERILAILEIIFSLSLFGGALTRLKLR
jgi:uncharacterized membrane protein